MSGIHWQKSSYSADVEHNACVELARVADKLLLRESDDPEVIAVSAPATLRALLRAVKSGEFDRLP